MELFQPSCLVAKSTKAFGPATFEQVNFSQTVTLSCFRAQEHDVALLSNQALWGYSARF